MKTIIPPPWLLVKLHEETFEGEWGWTQGIAILIIVVALVIIFINT